MIQTRPGFVKTFSVMVGVLEGECSGKEEWSASTTARRCSWSTTASRLPGRVIVGSVIKGAGGGIVGNFFPS